MVSFLPKALKNVSLREISFLYFTHTFSPGPALPGLASTLVPPEFVSLSTMTPTSTRPPVPVRNSKMRSNSTPTLPNQGHSHTVTQILHRPSAHNQDIALAIKCNNERTEMVNRHNMELYSLSVSHPNCTTSPEYARDLILMKNSQLSEQKHQRGEHNKLKSGRNILKKPRSSSVA